MLDSFWKSPIITQNLYSQYLNSMVDKSSAHTLEYILLGLIREEPAHGYALFNKLQSTKELSLIWQVKRSKLYYLLDRLEFEGLLTSSISSPGAYPDRHVYRLTARGEQVLDEWMSSPVLSSRYVRLVFLSKLYFVLRSGRDQAADLISQQINICQNWLRSLESQHQSLGEDEYINSQVFLFRMGQIQAMITWLENCQESIPD